MFQLGNLVLRQVFKNTMEVGAEKRQANWEGPYVVMKLRDFGSYHLETMNRTPLSLIWNVANLKKYYQ